METDEDGQDWQQRLDELRTRRAREDRVLWTWLYWLLRQLPEERRAPVVAAIAEGKRPLDVPEIAPDQPTG